MPEKEDCVLVEFAAVPRSMPVGASKFGFCHNMVWNFIHEAHEDYIPAVQNAFSFLNLQKIKKLLFFYVSKKSMIRTKFPQFL